MSESNSAPIRSDQVRSDQITSDQIRSDQVRSEPKTSPMALLLNYFLQNRTFPKASKVRKARRDEFSPGTPLASRLGTLGEFGSGPERDVWPATGVAWRAASGSKPSIEEEH